MQFWTLVIKYNFLSQHFVNKLCPQAFLQLLQTQLPTIYFQSCLALLVWPGCSLVYTMLALCITSCTEPLWIMQCLISSVLLLILQQTLCCVSCSSTQRSCDLYTIQQLKWRLCNFKWNTFDLFVTHTIYRFPLLKCNATKRNKLHLDPHSVGWIPGRLPWWWPAKG